MLVYVLNKDGKALMPTTPRKAKKLLQMKKCVSDGDYQQTKIPTGKIQGFRKFDKVSFLDKEYFIKGRMSSGYAILMDIDGKKVDLKPIPKFNEMKKVSARNSWIISQKTI